MVSKRQTISCSCLPRGDNSLSELNAVGRIARVESSLLAASTNGVGTFRREGGASEEVKCFGDSCIWVSSNRESGVFKAASLGQAQTLISYIFLWALVSLLWPPRTGLWVTYPSNNPLSPLVTLIRFPQLWPCSAPPSPTRIRVVFNEKERERRRAMKRVKSESEDPTLNWPN